MPLSQQGLDVDLPAPTTASPIVINDEIVVEYRRLGIITPRMQNQ